MNPAPPVTSMVCLAIDTSPNNAYQDNIMHIQMKYTLFTGATAQQ